MSLPQPSPNRRAVLSGLAGVAVLPAVSARAADRSAAFMAVGDWGRRGGRRQTDVAVAMAAAAAEVDSRFVLSVGDNFYPKGVRSTDDTHWTESFETPYAAASLQTPWYAALGNHDHRGLIEAQIDYSKVSSRWRMPSRYFQVAGAELGVPELDLFVMDTTPLVTRFSERIGQITHGDFHQGRDDRQVAWLEAALARSRARWKVVVGHHPIHSGGHHGPAPELVARIEPLLEAHGVLAYLCGHDHALQHIQVAHTHHICTGAGASAGAVASVEGMKFRYTRPGFAMFTVEADAIGLEFRDLNGRTLYEAPLGRPAG